MMDQSVRGVAQKHPDQFVFRSSERIRQPSDLSWLVMSRFGFAAKRAAAANRSARVLSRFETIRAQLFRARVQAVIRSVRLLSPAAQGRLARRGWKEIKLRDAR